MKKISLCVTFVLLNFLVLQAQELEWNMDNTASTLGERVVAIIDAGTIGSFTGVAIVGQVIDNNGNWGYRMPLTADFRAFVRFTSPEDYGIIQTFRTPYTILRLRKVSATVYHLTASCHAANTAMRILFRKVEGSANVTLGSTAINENGDIMVNEPTYLSTLSGLLDIQNGGEGKELLKFSTERPWVFQQDGTGSSSNLVLKDLTGGRSFKIKNFDNEYTYTFSATSGDSYFKGKMGIGTTTPDAKLTVKGNIHAEEVKVDLSVPAPDYVFEESYPLQKLSEVDTYIKQYKHLPEVPSALEMEMNGIDLGNMNMILLKKVEELTLYSIAAAQSNEELKASNQLLQEQLKALLERIEKLENR